MPCVFNIVDNLRGEPYQTERQELRLENIFLIFEKSITFFSVPSCCKARNCKARNFIRRKSEFLVTQIIFMQIPETSTAARCWMVCIVCSRFLNVVDVIHWIHWIHWMPFNEHQSSRRRLPPFAKKFKAKLKFCNYIL